MPKAKTEDLKDFQATEVLFTEIGKSLEMISDPIKKEIFFLVRKDEGLNPLDVRSGKKLWAHNKEKIVYGGSDLGTAIEVYNSIKIYVHSSLPLERRSNGH